MIETIMHILIVVCIVALIYTVVMLIKGAKGEKIKQKTCKSCGEEINAFTDRCPRCGAKIKTPFPFFAVVGFIALCVIVGMIYPESENNNSKNNNKSVSEETREEYIASCVEIPYDDIERNPKKYNNIRVVFTGRIVQVSEGSPCVYRVATDSYYNDVVYVTYRRSEYEPRLLEDDTITFYGVCRGVKTYETILKTKITIPCVEMKYYELQNN